MTRTPVTVDLGTSVAQVMKLFDRHDFNAFPVIDERGVVWGVVTKLDLLRAFRPDPALESTDVATVSAQSASDIMRRGVVTIEAEEPVIRAADLMVETRLHSLPVVDRRGGVPVLVGMVSRGDVLRALRLAPSESAPVPT